MTTDKLTVAVRMYDAGFGDQFLVTVGKGATAWRMVVDSGVHSQGAARPIAETVGAIVDDIRAADPSAPPHVDVVVATHHHADHISGFALDTWEQVAVDEVWVPFIEDRNDKDAHALRLGHDKAAHALLQLVEQRTHGLSPDSWPEPLAWAQAFAANSSGNERATDRLLGRNGAGFAGPHRVRYLPRRARGRQVIATAIPGVQVHVLGPSRDPKQLARMDPPAKAGWLTLDQDEFPGAQGAKPLFSPPYVMPLDDMKHDYPDLVTEHQRALEGLDEVNDEGLLAAASILENAVNNTSVFFVLDVGGLHLVFPGDSQWGAWQHVLDDPQSRDLVGSAVFYKIAHHGSGNATPKVYVDEVLADGAYAMLPWGLVEKWKHTIPQRALIKALAAHHHHVIKANAPVAVRGHVTVHGDLWSEVTFTTDAHVPG